MSELCLSGPTKSPHFSNLILSDLKLFFSFIHSHPLYFCYIIFFSPYILKLFSFLSPLFILLLSLLAICPQSKGDFDLVLSVYKALKEKLSLNTDPDDDFSQFEELELYKMVFDTSSFYQIEYSDEDQDNSICEIPRMGTFEALDLVDEKTVEVDWEESAKPLKEERNLEEFLEPLEDFENTPCFRNLHSIDPNKPDSEKEVFQKSTGSEEVESKKSAFSDSPSSGGLDSSLSSYGSMRREKEWTRTLACKLFEERHRGDGEEGMDLLWETYENDSSNKCKKTNSDTKKNKKMKKIDTEFRYEDDGDGDVAVGVCCLQALKFSTAKMNLGMGRPNIVKISKAIKGFGWLHNVTRHSKRGYTSNRVIN